MITALDLHSRREKVRRRSFGSPRDFSQINLVYVRLGIHELFHHVSSLISVLLDRSSSKKNEIIKVNALSFKTLLLEYEYICLSEKINTVSSDESFDLFPKTRNMSHIDSERTHPLDVHVTLHVSTDSNEEEQNDRNSIFFAWITILVWIHENMIGLTCVRRQRESFFICPH